MREKKVQKPKVVPKPSKLLKPKKTQFACDLCENIVFRCYATLYSHRRREHSKPLVPCFHCDETFFTYALRNAHYYHFASVILPLCIKRKQVNELCEHDIMIKTESLQKEN